MRMTGGTRSPSGELSLEEAMELSQTDYTKIKIHSVLQRRILPKG